MVVELITEIIDTKEGNEMITESHYQTKLKIFISQPMSGLSNEEILEFRKLAINNLDRMEEKYNQFYSDHKVKFEYIDNTQFDVVKTPLGYMAKDVELMDTADIVYFSDGWENSRGCNVEYALCKNYNKHMIFGCSLGVIMGSLHTIVTDNFKKVQKEKEDSNN